jgi:hypothetical protein
MRPLRRRLKKRRKELKRRLRRGKQRKRSPKRKSRRRTTLSKGAFRLMRSYWASLSLQLRSKTLC